MSQHEQLTRKRSNAMNSKQQRTEKVERAWYRAKARAEQAADRLSDCERKVARLREELNCAEVPGRTFPGPKGQNTARRSRNQTCTYHTPASIVTEGNISARLATNLRISSTENARKTGAASIARRRFKINVTEREHATILAALRLWQEADEHNRGDLRDIAEAAGVPLSNKEVDVL